MSVTVNLNGVRIPDPSRTGLNNLYTSGYHVISIGLTATDEQDRRA